MFRPYKVIIRPSKKTDPRVLGSDYISQGDMFRPYKVIIGPSKKTDPRTLGSVFLEGLIRSP